MGISAICTWVITTAIVSVTARLKFDYRFTSSVGLFPSVFNLAEGAAVFVNATCGQYESEVYCTLSGLDKQREQCGVCDGSKPDKAHHIELALDGEETWWQSPSLQYGSEYNFVTITVDLKKVFQVAYILIQSGPSPRPGNWILERSINGQQWAPWQFFALSDEECWHAFGLEPRKGKPRYEFDEEVICTSYFSGLEPKENGEIHISLVNGRPGASGPSQTLLDFTQARFIRVRLQRVRMTSRDQRTTFDFLDDMSLRRYFYSVRDITVGGQCPCNGHASECPVNQDTMAYQCQCQHSTCGALCDQCCPMYNQKKWRPGKFIMGNECEMCQCFGHAEECFYDPQVEAERRSFNMDGKLEGGGVCMGCRDDTTGVNCHLCKKGYFRPAGVSRFDKKPCKRCICDTFGSTGDCYPDGSQRDEGHKPGDCMCKPGYAGSECTQCGRGFFDYPKCAPCPCNLAGTLNGECDGDCLCKENVQGERCDQCKPGYYALHEANVKGCLQCFCYGITSECEAAEFGVELIQHTEGWVATDLRGTQHVEPFWSTMTSGVTIAEEEMHDVDTYYWEAPEAYIGNKLIGYGQNVRIVTSWHRGRGDTSGYFTKGPDLVLQGAGMLIASGFDDYPNTENTTMKVTLLEDEWYHIPDEIQDIPASNFKNKPSTFIGRRVFKEDFMKVMGGLERFLVRAKFHTDQLEGTLHTASLEIGSQKSSKLQKTWAVESCQCPLGYEGLSCEKCAYGFTRVNNTLFAGECRRCNCNGHATSCDPITLQCNECLHNTEGENCEKCKVGYYGNPVNGSPTDCKPCKCPLETESNNFSPSCQTSTLDYDRYSIAPEEYICTDCPKGYAGSHCERCANGYYGNPLKPGEFCQPCDCSGNVNPFAPNWCDHRTGECLDCQGNTSGWKCNECLPGFWGDPFSGQCHACDCNEYGSKHANCDLKRGQCECKAKYVGRTCSQCADGFGNIKAGCRQCNCNRIGSESDACEADTGQCRCHEGISGLTCNSCLDNHYGFSTTGCKYCQCHPKGSKASQCDLNTGGCQCYPNIVGRECNACQYGYWNINSERGCERCSCDPMGSLHDDCDDVTGQCPCKIGVGGLRCASCQEGYWGISSSGCVKCEPCSKPGHICDPDTGRCICPPLTQGSRCETCQLGTWDYHSYKGCKFCQCHSQGSISSQCDNLTGQCKCLQGFTGPKCNQCSPGFYNFPHCRPCNCDPAGTQSRQCNEDGSCQCDANGACLCKENAEGKKCASCRRGTYGLSSLNAKGCFQCFCFGRSNDCEQSTFHWTQITFSQGRDLTMTRGQTIMNQTHGLLELPDMRGDLQIGVESLFTTPLYWKLPEMFNGDRILSYNGFLRFSTWTNGAIPYSPGVLGEYPLVQLSGNSKIILEHFPRKSSFSGSYEVRLHEDDWVVKDSQRPASREMLMVALQNVQKILIRFSDSMEVTKAKLIYVTLDVARDLASQSLRPAIGIEVCQCPKEFKSTSCQDPGMGFYRYYESHFITTETMVGLIGQSKRCLCNDRAKDCHPATGVCMDCQDHTAGDRCDKCAMGHYGDPQRGQPCKPCRCPTTQNNFAQTCSINSRKEFNCDCRWGYTGPKCERCETGFYGQPLANDGECRSCDCHPLGSLSKECDGLSGQCECMPGVTGRDCSQCSWRHVLTKSKTCHDCNDMCTGTLLNEVLNIQNYFNHSNALNIDPTPALTLERYSKLNTQAKEDVKSVVNTKAHVRNLESEAGFLKPQADLSSLEAIKHQKSGSIFIEDAKQWFWKVRTFNTKMKSLKLDIEEIIQHLRNYAIGESADIQLRPALEETRNILGSIQRRDPSPYDIMVRTELSRARQSLSQVKEILYERDLAFQLKERIAKVEDQMNDLLKFIDQTLLNLKKGFTYNYRQNSTLKKTLEDCAEIGTTRESTENHLQRARDMSKESQDIVNHLSSHLRDLRYMFQRIQKSEPQWMAHLNQEQEELRLLGSQFVYPCQENSDKLVVHSKELRDMFENMVDINMGQTLRAANVYQNILLAVDTGRRASQKALEAAVEALERAAILKDNQVGQNAELSRMKSEDLSQEAEGLRQNSVDMGYQLQWILNEWKEYSVLIQEYSKTLDIMQQDLEYIPYASDQAQEAIHMADNALLDVDNVAEAMNGLFYHITKDLRAQTRDIQSFSESQLNQIPRQLHEASEDFGKVDKHAIYLHHRTRDVEELSAKVNKRLAELKRKVIMAQHAAASVQISITNDWEEATGCVRSFRLNMSASTTTEISLIYAIESPERDGLLVYLPSTQQDDFMAIEMVDRKIRFLWNNGAGTQAITHNVTIETTHDLVRDQHMWYKITAERVGNIGRLNVRKVEPIFDVPGFHRWIVGESAPNAQILDLQATDLLYVGGVPDALRSKRLLSDAKFNGVLYEMYVDNTKIGLWNFVTSRGCKETHMGITDKEDSSGCYTLNGQGYATQRDIGNFDPKYLSLAFEFKSFDAHAILMLIYDSVNNQYMSLTLKHGKVQLEIAYGSGSMLTFETAQTYNSGAWVKVEGARAVRNGAETGVLRVTFNGVTEDQMSSISLPPDTLFNMTGAVVFFGGVPPTFDPNYINLPSRNLLGSLRAITLSNPESNGILNPFNFQRHKLSPFHGIEPNCERKVIKVASFEGDGYLEVKSHDLRKYSTMSATFASREEDGLVLISTFQGQRDGGQVGDFFSIALVQGKLTFTFASSARPGDQLTFTSERQYHDGRFHSVVIHRINDEIRILVDDQEISGPSGLSLHSSVGDISGPALGGLYLGGVPTLLDFAVKQAIMVPTTRGFKGTLKDILFMDRESVRVVAMNEPTSFSKADIGRYLTWFEANLRMTNLWHVRPRSGLAHRNASNQSLQCEKNDPEPLSKLFAAQFSRPVRSSITARLRREEIQKEFDVSLWIRTFDQDGLIMASTSKKSSLYVFLQDGEMKVSYIHDGRKYQMEAKDIFDHGIWKEVRLSKKDNALSLTIDSRVSVTIQVPKRLHLSKTIVLGGQTGQQGQDADIPFFNGCMKDIKVMSRRLYLHTETNKAHNIFPCSKAIERGFHLRNSFMSLPLKREILEVDLKFSFKYIKDGMLGILQKQNHNVTMEITNSQMTAILYGLPEPVVLMEELPPPSSCGMDPWNTITLTITNKAFGIQLNAKVGKATPIHTYWTPGGEVFFGGAPFLDVDEYFHGCVKQVSINDEVIDGNKFLLTEQVLLDSCPI